MPITNSFQKTGYSVTGTLMFNGGLCCNNVTNCISAKPRWGKGKGKQTTSSTAKGEKIVWETVGGRTRYAVVDFGFSQNGTLAKTNLVLSFTLFRG